jgi:hypothetical protein
MVKTTYPRTAIVCCLSLTGVVLCDAPSAHARVTQVVITATESPTFGGKSFGSVGQYERISGQIAGEVDPKDPLNAVIVDLAPKAPTVRLAIPPTSRSCGRSIAPRAISGSSTRSLIAAAPTCWRRSTTARPATTRRPPGMPATAS